jgi:hypothetical protein
MREPKRWKDPSGGADAETRVFLQNVPGGTPSHAEMDRMWTGIATQLEFVAKPIQSPPAGSVASTAGAGALAGKVTMAVVLVAAIGAAVGVRALHSRARHESVPGWSAAKLAPSEASLPTRPTPAPPPIPQVAMPIAAPPPMQDMRAHPGKPLHTKMAASPSSQETAGMVASVGRALPEAKASAGQASPVAFTPPAEFDNRDTIAPAVLVRERTQEAAPPEEAPVSVNELLQESRRLDRARTALRAHNPALALQLLGALAPASGTLAQEREALTIEALAATPALRTTASVRARAFMHTYPSSPYRARIRAMVFESE